MKNKLVYIITCIALAALVLSGCGKQEEVILVQNLTTLDFAHDTPVGEITQDSSADQTFISNCDNITSIDLYGATYMRQNSGTVEVTIYTTSDSDIRAIENEKLQKIAKWTLDAAQFEDNKIITLNVDEAEANDSLVISYEINPKANKGLLGKQCMIKLSSPDCKPGSSVTFWTTQEDVYPDGCVRIGGYEWYNDLWFQVYGLK